MFLTSGQTGIGVPIMEPHVRHFARTVPASGAASLGHGAGNTATTSYDTVGRVASTNDGKATTTYAYNGTDANSQVEYRGLVTAKTVTGLVGASAAFTAAYDPDGALVVESHPNGMRVTTLTDPAGQETSATYTAAGGGVIAGFSRSVGTDGTIVVDTGLGRASRFGYDRTGRLTDARTELTGAGTCTARLYGFDDDSNRTALTTWAGTVGACPDTATTPTATAPRTYDAAGRATLTGYTYDALGRTRTLPAAESHTGAQVGFAYYGNDLAATRTSGTSTRAYGLDAVGRIVSWTDTANGTTGPTAVNHYADSSDSPVWTDLGDGTWTRAVTGISGNLATQVTGNTNGPTTTTAQVVDLHGDVVATLDNTPNANAVSSTTAYTEYGTPADGSTPGRYGWLGAKQRPTDTLTGILLMGVRLYNTVTGRFLQTDPVPGGSAGPYLYPTNPITVFDLNGQWWGSRLKSRVMSAARMLLRGARAFALWWTTSRSGSLIRSTCQWGPGAVGSACAALTLASHLVLRRFAQAASDLVSIVVGTAVAKSFNAVAGVREIQSKGWRRVYSAVFDTSAKLHGLSASLVAQRILGLT